jgi:hypothetical protein
MQPNRRYRVMLDNSGHEFETTGAELAHQGLPVLLDQKHTSELVRYVAPEAEQ